MIVGAQIKKDLAIQNLTRLDALKHPISEFGGIRERIVQITKGDQENRE
jgi:hypothetical protein